MRPLGEFPVAARRALRGIITDVDGTLTTNGRITGQALGALERAKAAAAPFTSIAVRTAGCNSPNTASTLGPRRKEPERPG